MADLSVLKNIVRTGRVSSVQRRDADPPASRSRTRGNRRLYPGELKVIKNPAVHSGKGSGARGRRAKAAEAVKRHFADHSHAVKIAPWLPSPGDYVFMPVYPDGRRRRVRDWRDINNGAYRELG